MNIISNIDNISKTKSIVCNCMLHKIPDGLCLKYAFTDLCTQNMIKMSVKWFNRLYYNAYDSCLDLITVLIK